MHLAYNHLPDPGRSSTRRCYRHGRRVTPAAEEALDALLALPDDAPDAARDAGLAAFNAAVDAPWLTRPLRRTPDPDERLATLSQRCGDRLRDWALWHMDRGAERGPVAAWGAKPIVRLLEEIAATQWLVDEVADDHTMDDAFAALHAALTEARDEAEQVRVSGDPLADDQAAEMEDGPLRTIIRAWADVEHIRRDMRDGMADPLVAVADAAFLVVLNVPACVVAAKSK